MSRRVAGALLVLSACVALRGNTTRLGAQVPAGAQMPGMPDLSGAPADVQAIWKKMTTGGVPTQAEAKRLAEWMQANKGQIIKSANAKVDSLKRGMNGGSGMIGVAGADRASCPKKTTLPASLSLDITAAGATQLLDSIRRTYTARLSAKDAGVVTAMIGKATTAAQLNGLGGALYIKGYPVPSVLAFVTEVAKASGTSAQSAWGDLGVGLIAANDYPHAIRALRRALAVGGRTAPYVTNLGVAYADAGDFGAATTLLTEATRLSQNWAPAWDALSSVASCDGNQAMALRAAQSAQDDDWSDSRQDDIKQMQQQNVNGQQDANVNSSAADDEDAPMPDPPGRSPFPPPPPGQPHTFDSWAPKLGDTWQEQRANELFDTQMSQAYRQLEFQIGSERNKPWVTSPPGSAGSMGMVFMISNGAVATHGAGRVDDIVGARMAKLTREWADRDSSILRNGVKAAEPVQTQYNACMKNGNDDKCLPPYCRGMTSVTQQIFSERRANAAEIISGFGSLSVTATAKMDAWFDWAGDPDSRHTIDRMRRARLASMETFAYVIAAQAQGGPPEECARVTNQKGGSAKAQADSARDAGECKSRSIHLPFFAKMDADCHAMKMTFDYFDEFGTPTFELQRASSTKNGKIFIGLGGDALGGALGGTVGFQLTWDQGGWVTGSGIAATGEAGFDGAAHASGDIFVNGQGGTTSVSGSASGSVPAFGFAPSVNFGGK